MKQINTGGLSFAEMRNRGKYYVDKSMLIADLLSSDDSGVYLFTRPRRFGKTTNLTMLDAFFNIEYKGNTWFEELEITDHHEFDDYRNAFPIVFIDLKDTKAANLGDFILRVKAAVRDAFDAHRYLLQSDRIYPDERSRFQEILEMRTENALVRDCIPLLCKMLERYHHRKVIILIDEYDSAVSDVFGSDSQRPILDFLRDFMKPALKSNNNLQMACVTGVMQIAKESLFSDLNNVSINSIFSTVSDERFGFTESEVRSTLNYFGHPEKYDEAKKWYDGYRFGNADVYNPYSIMCYISQQFDPKPYWINSGGDSILRWLLQRVNRDRFADIIRLTTGESFETALTDSLVFEDVHKGNNQALYSLMAMSGYLKAVPVKKKRFVYNVSIPNAEVNEKIDRLIESLNPIDTDLFSAFSIAVLNGDADAMADSLERILDGGSYLKLHEDVYEAVLMTVMYSLTQRYEVKMEQDAGNGRIDILMRPKVAGDPPLVFELKVAHSKKDLDKELDDAFWQIHDRRYYAGMPGKVILIGISFFVKTPKVRIEVIDNGPDGFGYRKEDS